MSLRAYFRMFGRAVDGKNLDTTLVTDLQITSNHGVFLSWDFAQYTRLKDSLKHREKNPMFSGKS